MVAVTQARQYSAEPAESPKEYSDKIKNIVKDITSLNLFEVAELTACLKVFTKSLKLSPTLCSTCCFS